MTYPREQHLKSTVGMKTMIIAAAAVVPHWGTSAKIDALNIETSAPGDTALSAGLAGTSETGLFFC